MGDGAEDEPAGPGRVVGLGGWIHALVGRDGALVGADGAALIRLAAATGAERGRRELAASALLVHAGRLIVGTQDGAVHIVDLATLATIVSTTIAGATIVSLASDGSALAVGAGIVGLVVVLDLDTLVRRTTISSGYGLPLGLVMHDGWIGFGDEEATYHVVDAGTGEARVRRRIGDLRAIQITAAAVSPAGRTLAILTECGGGELVEAATLSPLGGLPDGWACLWEASGGLWIGELAAVHVVRDGTIEATHETHPAARGHISALAIDRVMGQLAVGYESGDVWTVVCGPRRRR